MNWRREDEQEKNNRRLKEGEKDKYSDVILGLTPCRHRRFGRTHHVHLQGCLVICLQVVTTDVGVFNAEKTSD